MNTFPLPFEETLGSVIRPLLFSIQQADFLSKQTIKMNWIWVEISQKWIKNLEGIYEILDLNRVWAFDSSFAIGITAPIWEYFWFHKKMLSSAFLKA